SARWAVQHGQAAAVASHDHFGGEAVVAIAVLPFSAAQLALDVNLAALFQEALDHADQAVAVDGNIVPFGALSAFAGGAVFPVFRRGNAHVRDLAALLEGLDVRIRAQISYQNDLVD